MGAIGRSVRKLIRILELSVFTRGELERVAPDMDALFSMELLIKMHPMAQSELIEVAEGSL